MEKRQFWTEEEEQFLRENYSSLGAEACSRKLNKTKQSVFAKASRLGVISRTNKLKTHEEYENELFSKELLAWPVEPYQGSHHPIVHECLEEHQWQAKPYSILQGKGCPICAKKRSTKRTYSSEIKFKVLEPYINSSTPITHECEKGHQWKARPNSILAGTGCPYCCSYSFDLSAPAILYYICIDEEYYKIGVTNNTVKKRFAAETKDIRSIQELKLNTGLEAKEKESSILAEFKEHRLNVPGYLISGGNTELFSFDILGLDK